MQISIELDSTWWKSPPKTKIFFDDALLWADAVKDKILLSFEVSVQDKTKSTLCIELLDKKIDETVIKNNQIIKDQLLHINQIAIDKINLDYLIFTGKYKPHYPDHMIQESLEQNTKLPDTLDKIDTLGFNGLWSISFDHPFHIWYLQNLP